MARGQLQIWFKGSSDLAESSARQRNHSVKTRYVVQATTVSCTRMKSTSGTCTEGMVLSESSSYRCLYP